ncbi:MAG: transcription termination/antitermination protein NusG [Akkermansiaceae bacterium]
MSSSLNSYDEVAWYCVRTQSKRENVASQLLKQLEGVETFCPRLRYRKVTRRGKIWWVEAMFPGYIFARFTLAENERAVLHTQGVMTLLKFGNYYPQIPVSFVEDLRKMMSDQENETNGMLTLEPVIQKGDEVELAHCALQGFKGTVVEVLPAVERVKVLIELLGDNQVIETDLFSLLLPRKPL